MLRVTSPPSSLDFVQGKMHSTGRIQHLFACICMDFIALFHLHALRLSPLDVRSGRFTQFNMNCLVFQPSCSRSGTKPNPGARGRLPRRACPLTAPRRLPPGHRAARSIRLRTAGGRQRVIPRGHQAGIPRATPSLPRSFRRAPSPGSPHAGRPRPSPAPTRGLRVTAAAPRPA